MEIPEPKEKEKEKEVEETRESAKKEKKAEPKKKNLIDRILTSLFGGPFYDPGTTEMVKGLNYMFYLDSRLR